MSPTNVCTNVHISFHRTLKLKVLAIWSSKNLSDPSFMALGFSNLTIPHFILFIIIKINMKTEHCGKSLMTLDNSIFKEKLSFFHLKRHFFSSYLVFLATLVQMNLTVHLSLKHILRVIKC